MCELGDPGHVPNPDGLECKASLLARSPGDRDSMNLTCFSLPQRTAMLSYPEGSGELNLRTVVFRGKEIRLNGIWF